MVDPIKLISSNNGLIESRCDNNGFNDCLCDFNIFQIGRIKCIKKGKNEISTIITQGNWIVLGDDNFILRIGIKWRISEGI